MFILMERAERAGKTNFLQIMFQILFYTCVRGAILI